MEDLVLFFFNVWAPVMQEAEIFSLESFMCVADLQQLWVQKMPKSDVETKPYIYMPYPPPWGNLWYYLFSSAISQMSSLQSFVLLFIFLISLSQCSSVSQMHPNERDDNTNFFVDSILSQLQVLSKSSCIQEAVSPILPQCISSGIDSVSPEMKREASIKLSVCEFEASGVSYPIECTNTPEKNYELCMLKLKSSPQFWTTFSGNYRELGSMCYEASLPYEKNQIVAVYSNITRLFANLIKHMEYTETKADTFQTKFSEMYQGFNDMNAELFKNHKDEFISYMGELKLKFDSANMQVQEKYSQAMESAKIEIMDDFHEMKDLIFSTSEDLKFLEHDFWVSFEALSDSSLEILSRISHELDSVEIRSAEGIKVSERLADGLARSEQLAYQVEDSLSNSLLLIQSQEEVLENQFRDTLSIISEEIILEVSINVNDFNLNLQESFNNLDVSVNRIQSKLEEAEESLSHFTAKIDNIFEFLNGIGSLFSCSFVSGGWLDTVVGERYIMLAKLFLNGVVLLAPFVVIYVTLKRVGLGAVIIFSTLILMFGVVSKLNALFSHYSSQTIITS